MGTIWVMSLLTWPVFFFFALIAWSRIDAGQIESDPAMGGLALLRFLLLPVARASLTLAAVLVFVLALNNFAVPALLQVKVFPAQVWIQFETKLDAPAAFLTSIPLIVAPLFLLLLASKRELTWPVQSNVTARALRSQLGRPLLIVSGFVAVSVLLLSLLLPAWQLMSARRTWIDDSRSSRDNA